MITQLKKLDQLLLPRSQHYRYSPYIWLVYLFFFFISFLSVAHSPIEYGLMGVGIGCFLALYFNVYWVKPSRVKFNIIGIVLIATLMTSLSEGASVLFVYAGAFCCKLGSPRRAVMGIVAIICWILFLAMVFELSRYFYLPGIIFTTFIGGINIYQHEMDKKNQALLLSQQEIKQLAQTAERERIARDLHDLIGHTFSVLTLKADLAGKLVERDPQRAKLEIKDIENLSRDALSQVREVVTGIRAFDLLAQLTSTKYILQTNEISFDYHLSELNISDELNKELAIIVKELTTNVIKHANASKVTASVLQNDQGISLSFKDNGQGLEPDQDHGHGLKGVQERLAKWQGSLTMANHQGCDIKLFISSKNLELQP